MQITNKKASFNYEVIDTYIAGIVLLGKEIKSIREGKVSISESFCTVDKGELMIGGRENPPFQWWDESPHYSKCKYTQGCERSD